MLMTATGYDTLASGAAGHTTISTFSSTETVITMAVRPLQNNVNAWARMLHRVVFSVWPAS